MTDVDLVVKLLFQPTSSCDSSRAGGGARKMLPLMR